RGSQAREGDLRLSLPDRRGWSAPEAGEELAELSLLPLGAGAEGGHVLDRPRGPVPLREGVEQGVDLLAGGRGVVEALGDLPPELLPLAVHPPPDDRRGLGRRRGGGDVEGLAR